MEDGLERADIRKMSGNLTFGLLVYVGWATLHPIPPESKRDLPLSKTLWRTISTATSVLGH
jgi:hypothetical protein